MKEKPNLSVEMSGEKKYTIRQKNQKAFAVLTGHDNTAQAQSETGAGLQA